MGSEKFTKYCLITGCSDGGIGHAMARQFIKRGVHVFATARTPSKIGNLADDTNVTVLPLDVTSNTSIQECLAAVKAQTGGKLDYLVNNAGSQYVMSVLDVELDKAKAMYDVNVWGLVAVCKAFGPIVIAAKGTIVNMASIAGCIYPPFMGLYAGSKAAVDRISETLRLEMAPFDVKVVTCITGSIATRLFDNATIDPLPQDSYYRPAEKEFELRAKGQDVKQHSSPEEFARALVADVVAGATGHVYRGKMSSMIGHASAHFSDGIIDMMVLNGTGLNKLKAPV